nr:MAG TPA: hypothetical protein [Caudoviricetes sp.]
MIVYFFCLRIKNRPSCYDHFYPLVNSSSKQPNNLNSLKGC